MKDRSELARLLVEIAIASGRKRQSPQTGLVHYYHGAQEGEPHLPIPIVENLLFALALLKSRTMENVAEAKDILDKMLHFQNMHYGEMGAGNFPIYVHDYPICKDRFISAHSGLALYWILKSFHQILGNPLKERTEIALEHAIKHALLSLQDKAAPYQISLKIAAVAKAGGALLQQPELEQKGGDLLDQLRRAPDASAWMCPASLGAMLLALAPVYPRLSESPWSDLWEYLGSTWHRPTGCYAGPALKEWQMMAEPQMTVYDLYMGLLSGAYSSRALKDSPVHLEAALIPPNDDILPEHDYPFVRNGVLGNAAWTLYHGKNIAYSALQKDPTLINPATEKGYHLLRMVWGNLQRVHSLVCPGGSYQDVAYKSLPNGFDMLIRLGKRPADDEEREKTREIAFYGDIHEAFEISIAEGKATTFQIEDRIVFKSGGIAVALQFSLESGDGNFIGHRMFSNRPSQIGAKGIHKYEAYDWTVFLRTLERSEECAVRIAVTIEDSSEG